MNNNKDNMYKNDDLLKGAETALRPIYGEEPVSEIKPDGIGIDASLILDDCIVSDDEIVEAVERETPIRLLDNVSTSESTKYNLGKSFTSDEDVEEIITPISYEVADSLERLGAEAERKSKGDDSFPIASEVFKKSVEEGNLTEEILGDDHKRNKNRIYSFVEDISPTTYMYYRGDCVTGESFSKEVDVIVYMTGNFKDISPIDTSLYNTMMVTSDYKLFETYPSESVLKMVVVNGKDYSLDGVIGKGYPILIYDTTIKGSDVGSILRLPDSKSQMRDIYCVGDVMKGANILYGKDNPTVKYLDRNGKIKVYLADGITKFDLFKKRHPFGADLLDAIRVKPCTGEGILKICRTKTDMANGIVTLSDFGFKVVKLDETRKKGMNLKEAVTEMLRLFN